jgi:hypothetical protein
LISFWRIDSEKANTLVVVFESVTVDDSNLCIRLCGREKEQRQDGHHTDAYRFRG